ncbi:glycoside hydrolase family 43 protein [Filimonas effusa]|uniref:Glycosyl hydrolase 43 family protein n=1 Tax=Filimonas effusa TaxID=2508721 RepID=A0A4Q1D9S6_9BACT|nr:glycoside hydrolase 43 family protein [Filimonas effusa]RXK85485.1 glycosyl hydrolase 43 family protein [Filimonas effusa]
MKAIVFLLGAGIFAAACSAVKNPPSPHGENTAEARSTGTGKNITGYSNPVIWADVPDMSVTRLGSDFYLISTTMHLMPGAPVMKSKDLVHWEIVSYVFDSLTDNSKYNLLGGTVYGRGQWASSIRFHKGKFYVLFSPNDQPYKAYIYSTTNPSGKWNLVTRTQHFHDASLFFDDDDRVYVFSGTGSLKELKPDLSDVKPGGVSSHVFERDQTETGLLEGSQVIKHNGKYYLLMISWPRGKPRRQVCYRADKITGPYQKKVILEDNFAGFPYAGQGAIIDDEKGNWYGLIFQDRGGVGRVPLLMPVRWVDGWPMLGDENGKVPLQAQVPLKTHDNGTHIVESDDFSGKKLKLNWQWNHNPVTAAWTVTERPGYLRLKTSRLVENLYAAPNTLTQRMEGPLCTGVASFDVSAMKDGDVAGMAAFNGHSGVLSVVMEGTKKYLAMSSQLVNLDNEKAITTVDSEEKQRVELNKDIVYLRVDGDFNLDRDIAAFYYSFDNKNWNRIGPDFKMKFDYTRHFMGTKFALFNYATKANGGYVDVDFFNYSHKQ